MNRTREAGLERALRRRRPESRFRVPRTWSRRNPGARYWAAPGTPDTRTTSDERILIVDDESAIRLICRLNLGSSGFETFEAADGDSAVRIARAERPDLILLDVMLPGKDGWEVAEELAAVDGTREIPILFLSARSDRTDESRGYELGGVGYITKPFDPSEMIERVRHVLARVGRGERVELRDEWRDRIRHD